MYKYNKILVGLDRSENDQDIIKAASTVSSLSATKEIYFVNVLKDFQLPEKLQKEFPTLLDSAINERKQSLQASIDEFFTHKSPEIKIHVIVEQGQATKSILKHSIQRNIDLIVLGRKNNTKASSVFVGRIARRAACSLLIIPEDTEFKTDNILIPTDFSDYSRKAMEKVVTFAHRAGDKSKLYIQNVYQVPTGYHYSGKSFKEFSDIMKEHAKNDYKKFIRDFNLKNLEVEEIYSLDKDEDIISDIYKVARKIKADLIAIGAKGRTAASALFIGSKAERLIQLDNEIPLLVVRPKGKRVGLLDFIREM